jgi:cell division protein FtsI/penicillin-binding protein 2
MKEVVTGHVTQAAVPGHSVGGKTGTSQIPIPGGYDEDETIASFCGFLPVDHPRAVILVKVDKPEDTRGQEVAAPVFRKVAEAVIAAMDLPDDQPVAPTEAAQP